MVTGVAVLPGPNPYVPAPELGFTLQCDFDAPRTVAIARAAEAAGFAYGWLFDSPLMWRDPYPLLTLMAAATSRLRLGTCVTNPRTRHPTTTAALIATLQGVSHGRMDLGMGRGDSALRLLGEPPASPADVERAVEIIRGLVEGREVDVSGRANRLVYATDDRLTVWVAGYGPKALASAARVADGVIIQVGDPELVAWYAARIRRAVDEAGRDPSAFRIQVAAPAIVGDPSGALDGVRWFPALVSNHVVDLLRREDPRSLPAGLVAFVERRGKYDYVPQHDGDYSFIDDDTVARFCVLGDERDHIRRVRDLFAAGATQVNLYLTDPDPESTIAAYGRAIIPEMIAARRAT